LFFADQLIDRKAMLMKLLRQSNRVRCAEHVEAQGEALSAKIDQLKLERNCCKRAARRIG
jgi:hypothetical protein